MKTSSCQNARMSDLRQVCPRLPPSVHMEFGLRMPTTPDPGVPFTNSTSPSSVLGPAINAFSLPKPAPAEPVRPSTPLSSPVPASATQHAPRNRDSGFQGCERDEHTIEKSDHPAAAHDDSGFPEPGDEEKPQAEKTASSPYLSFKQTVQPAPVKAAPKRTIQQMPAETVSVKAPKPVQRASAKRPRPIGEIMREMPTGNKETHDAAKARGEDMDEGGAEEADESKADEAALDDSSINVGNDTITLGEVYVQDPEDPEDHAKTQQSINVAPSGSSSSPSQLPTVFASILDLPSDAESDSNDDQDSQEHDVSHISNHRLARDGSEDIEVLVHWEGSDSEPTWESEDQIQRGAREALADYWNSLDGGRLAVKPYEVFAIRGHQWVRSKPKTGAPQSGSTAKGRPKLCLRIEWLGYVEETLEPATRFAKDQPQLVSRYFELLGGRPKAP